MTIPVAIPMAAPPSAAAGWKEGNTGPEPEPERSRIVCGSDSAEQNRRGRTAEQETVESRQTIKEGTGVGSVISTGRNRRAGPVGVAGPLLAARWPLTPFLPQPPLPG